MKTPQEIARRWGHESWNDPKAPCLCWLCPLLRDAVGEFDVAIAAAREEGRREGLEQAARCAETFLAGDGHSDFVPLRSTRVPKW